MKFLFIHALVTLEYFNFKRENKFKSFVVYFYCFNDNCFQVTVGGNEIDPCHDHSFKGSLDSEQIPTSSVHIQDTVAT